MTENDGNVENDDGRSVPSLQKTIAGGHKHDGNDAMTHKNVSSLTLLLKARGGGKREEIGRAGGRGRVC